MQTTRATRTRPVVSVLTACLPSASEFLGEAASSVASARAALGDTATLEWILALDGPGELEAPGAAEAVDAADAVIRLTRNRGVSVARNYALTRATGALLTNLDGDDLLDPAGVAAGVRELEGDPDLGWVAANRLLVTGERTFHWHGARAWPAGSVAAEWSAPSAFHSNTLVVRTDLVRSVGGWPALGACEDLLLALLLGEAAPGRSIPEVLIRYRAWEGQTTNDPGFRTEQATAYDFIESTVNVRRAVVGRAPVIHPEPLGGEGSKPV